MWWVVVGIGSLQHHLTGNRVGVVRGPVDGAAPDGCVWIALKRGGAFGYTVRVVPTHPLVVSPAELGVVATA